MERKVTELSDEYVVVPGKGITQEGFSREAPSKKKKRHKGLAIAGIATALALAVAYNVAGSFTFDNAMLREQSMARITKVAENRNAFENDAHNSIAMEDRSEWFRETNKNIVNIQSDDGLRLSAYEFVNPTHTNKWIITFHGYRSNAKAMHAYIYHFFNEGYNVLAPDLRGCGNSDGKYVEMGYADRMDVLKWVDTLVERDSSAQIVLHGLSMGAATVMMATGEKLPENVKAAVEDSGYTGVWDQLRYVGKTGTGLPEWLLDIALSSASVISKVKTGHFYSKMSTIDQLKKSVTPTLFIHGTDDSFVPYYMLDEVYSANENIDKEKLSIEGATHGYAATMDPDRYYSTIFNFINRYWDD